MYANGCATDCSDDVNASTDCLTGSCGPDGMFQYANNNAFSLVDGCKKYSCADGEKVWENDGAHLATHY